MRFLALILFSAGAGRSAGISDAESTVLLHQGDSLIFQIQTSSFGYNASRFGLSTGPSDLNFSFVSAPAAMSGNISVWLDSAVVSGPLSFAAAQYYGSQYQGPVAAVQALLHLSPLLSSQILSSQTLDLAIRNEGPDLELGLPPNSLRQDLSVSLSGGPLTVGAPASAVSLDSAPEPGTAALIVPALGIWYLAGVRRAANRS
ncbi:MAG TPA: hypothetical protein VMH28_19680 [Candidatus Acidoferrales bacterium]|nr:hypothetical protein [Candidatus Acidoferrales bacterium]